MSNGIEEPIFLIPYFQEKIWGGEKLKNEFGYDIPSSKTGECWAISAHPHGQSIVKSGHYKGLSLGELWELHPELFGNYQARRFPILVKIIDAFQDLSVQVHPKGNQFIESGKTECWYVLDCKKDAEIVYGHTANTKDELIELIENKEWSKLLRKVKIKPGDLIYVPSGTIHALCAGTLVLEVQQNSDITYRIYDYDRKVDEGNFRKLDIEKAIEVITVPDKSDQHLANMNKNMKGLIEKSIKSPFFTVQKIYVSRKASFNQNQPFLLVNVLGGEGKLIKCNNIYTIKKGDHFILPANFGEFKMIGNIDLIFSYP